MLVAVVLATAPALVDAQLSLTTVVTLAQRNSSAVKLADADKRKAEALLDEARDAYLPSLDFGSGLPAFPPVGFSGNPPSIFNANIQLLLPYVNLPQKRYIEAAHSGFQAASLRLNDVLEQVALDASTAYIELDTVERELDAAHQQESFAERLVTIEQERAEAGVDPLSEWLQARLTAAQLKLKRMHLETRAATLSQQLAALTGLPASSITPDHASIPEIPEVKADEARGAIYGIKSAQMLIRSKQSVANGDTIAAYFPQIAFNMQYSRESRIWNNADDYFKHPLKSDNLSSGFSIQLPLFDWGLHSKAKLSATEELRAKVEAEQAQRQNELQIAELSGSLRELYTIAEIASLKQQIAKEQLTAVLAQLELGNGSAGGPGAPAQLTPKAEQLARIDERQNFVDALDAGFDLAKTRLSLLRALGHMEDWLLELHVK